MDSPGLFARLTPRNNKARRAFSSAAEAILQDEQRFAHHRKFISISRLQVPIESPRAVSTSTDTDTDPDSGDHAAFIADEEVGWSGCYHFSLDHAPSKPRAWRAGAGRWNNDAQGDIDLLLNYDMPQYGIRGSHLWFLFDKTSGTLLVTARHQRQAGITLNTERLGREDGFRALDRPTSLIQIDNLDYEFSYQLRDSAAEDDFQVEKARFFSKYLNAPPPIEATSVTPSANDMILGPWTLRRIVGRGSYGLVSAASHRDGSVAAFKSFLRDSHKSDQDARSEIEIAQELKSILGTQKHRKRILELKDVIYQRGKPEYDGGPPEQVFLLYTPLARGTFLSEIWRKGNEPLPREVKITPIK